ncbi:hypothetical protein N7456_010149 [Penicillium angulare]|uniref:Uncharacterized protein n=1 Tax=Penicillium angulare TaxID=116970 RepID=A0A9W9K5X4_9EURO|nr:hypothetical protein N7456_010149 [Penicillium angulare]
MDWLPVPYNRARESQFNYERKLQWGQKLPEEDHFLTNLMLTLADGKGLARASANAKRGKDLHFAEQNLCNRIYPLRHIAPCYEPMLPEGLRWGERR